MISKSLFSRFEEKPELQGSLKKFVCGNGQTLEAEGKVILNMVTEAGEYPITSYVTDLGGRNIAILGMDNMHRLQAMIDMCNGSMFILPCTGYLYYPVRDIDLSRFS